MILICAKTETITLIITDDIIEDIADIYENYTSIVKRTEKQVNVPEILLDVANANVGTF